MCALVVPSWDRAINERWRRLQSHLLNQHANLFGVIMRVTRPGVIERGDPVRVHHPDC